MTCSACATQPNGLTIAGCRQCSLRQIARGLPHFESIRDGAPTAAYRAQLAAMGGKPTAVHAEVKAIAASINALKVTG